MPDEIIPQEGNSKKGFHYSITDQQIAQYGKQTLLEKLAWLKETNKFIYSLQTTEERELRRNIGNMKM